MNHDLKIFPGDAHVLRLESIVVKRPLLNVFLARQHQFCHGTMTLRRMRSEPPQRYMELSSSFLDA
jgi:hypothetical protein